ncbi:MAG: hypothetical protein IT558_01060 [Alphaproteobacteria bacterium]|nr:hypothetical protein [Alphaproteobacteria bacterium]
MKQEDGNALWFILVAVVLLGILTMVLSRSGTNVEQSGNIEQQRIRASQILRYAKGLQSSIEQMKLRGVSENQISFQNSTTVTNYTNAACNVSDCRVFDVGGGGQEYRAPPAGANDGSEWIFTGANNAGSTAYPVGTTAARSGNDLIMLLPNADPALCKQINRDLTVGTAGTIPEDASGIDVTAFTGTYDNVLKIIDGDPSPLELDGKQAGCFINTLPNPDVTYFYYVLMAR